jgi:glycosyltransferase involved in cell wall biosynthesis
MTPTVSLITATFNRRHLLPRLIRSIQSQSLKNFEWIIVDDGSTDGTAELILSLRDERIRLIRQLNMGCNAARNRAEQEITSNLVIHIDSDDEFFGAQTIARMVDRIQQSPPSVGAVAFAVTTPEGGGGASKINSNEILIGYEELLCGKTVHGEFFRIFKREAIEISTWASHYEGMEILKYLAIAQRFKTLYVNEIALIYHMNHGGNLTSARQTIRRAHSMIEGYERLIREHQEGFRHACPGALGLNLFHTAMYCAIDGQNRRAIGHAIHSLQEKGPKLHNLILLASLLIPLQIRRKLFVWRSTLKGRQ